MPTVILIDSSSLIFRAFYAIQEADDSKHLQTSLGLYEHWLKKLMNTYNAEYAAAAMDLNNRKSNNFELDDSYKAGRTYPQLLSDNFSKFHQVSKDLGITTFGVDGNEADDTIASTANIISKAKGYSTIIVSSDKDLLQLVDDSKRIQVVSLLPGAKFKSWNNEAVNKKFKVEHPWQVADFKGLAGDSSDNYFGIQGIGPKSASNLLHKYNTVDGIYKALYAGRISGKVASLLTNGEKDAKMCYKLAKLNPNLKVPITSIKNLAVDKALWS